MPRLSNQEIKRLAFGAVVIYERKQSRQAEIVERRRDGYDILSQGNGDERHIEVKGSISVGSARIGLEPSELNHMQKDARFYLYIVRNVGVDPSVHVFRRNDLLQHFKKIDYQYVFCFNRADFGE